MTNNNIKPEITVNENKVGIMRVDDIDYISLTDLARYANEDDPSGLIKQWMSNKDSFDFYGLWEEMYNNNFNSVEFHRIKNIETGRHRFIMNPTRWKRDFNSIGIIPSSGKYSKGTYAHPDIAFEFASWLSPEFKLYLITEFERLKKNELYQNSIEWHANRLLCKANYLVHTDAIKNYIIPKVNDEQIRKTYADEADLINVALFGMSAHEWRLKNPELAKEGNIRDYTDMIHLIILSNLENINASLISKGISQGQRLIELNNIAINQLELFKNNKSIEELKLLEKKGE